MQRRGSVGRTPDGGTLPSFEFRETSIFEQILSMFLISAKKYRVLQAFRPTLHSFPAQRHFGYEKEQETIGLLVAIIMTIKGRKKIEKFTE